MVDFLINDLIGSASPEQKRGKAVTVDDVLARADAGIEAKFAGQPMVEAAIRLALGRTFEATGQYEKSRRHLERAVALDERHLGAEHPDTLGARNALGWTLYRLKKREEARSLFTAALESCRRALGAEHAETLRAMDGLACTLDDAGRAIALHEEVLAIKQRIYGSDDRETCRMLNNLAISYRGAGRHREARRLYERIVELRSRDDPDDPLLLMAMTNLSNVHDHLGEIPRDEFVGRCRRLADASVRVLGPGHPNARGAMNLYYWSLIRGRRLDTVRAFVEETITRSERELGFGDGATQYWYDRKEYVMRQERKPPDAIVAFIESHLERVREAFGPEAAETQSWMQTRGPCSCRPTAGIRPGPSSMSWSSGTSATPRSTGPR